MYFQSVQEGLCSRRNFDLQFIKEKKKKDTVQTQKIWR